MQRDSTKTEPSSVKGRLCNTVRTWLSIGAGGLDAVSTHASRVNLPGQRTAASDGCIRSYDLTSSNNVVLLVRRVRKPSVAVLRSVDLSIRLSDARRLVDGGGEPSVGRSSVDRSVCQSVSRSINRSVWRSVDIDYRPTPVGSGSDSAL